MIFNISGGGGASLNFKVLAYDAEIELLAATPAENTIGIITNTPITSWMFSAEEPSPAVPGMVWITISNSSPVAFNALKKNGVMIYPISAKQFIVDAWVDVPAKSYQADENGTLKWNAWLVYLYNNGDNESVSGGWATIRGYSGAYTDTSAPACTVNDDSIVFHNNKSGNIAGFLKHNKPIDLTPYTKVHYSGNATCNSGTAKLNNCQPAIISPNVDSLEISKTLKSGGLEAFGDFEDLEVDVRNINEEAVVSWKLYSYGGDNGKYTVTIRKIWLTT